MWHVPLRLQALRDVTDKRPPLPVRKRCIAAKLIGYNHRREPRYVYCYLDQHGDSYHRYTDQYGNPA
jgi:hypothetical protein